MDSDTLLAGLFWAIFIGAAFLGLGWKKIKALVARSWPLVQGNVESVTVTEHRTRQHVKYYVVQIAYSYSVDGEYYSGFFDKTFWRERFADQLAADARGKAAFIRHKPASPHVSALLNEDQQTVWGMRT